MSREAECTLPSGLSGVIRPWKLGDLSVFTDLRLARRPGPAIEAELLRRAWVRTSDVGPYAFDGNPPWLKEVLQGDHLDALRQVRILTWGAEYEVNLRCSESICNARMQETVDLEEDLKVRPLTDESAAIYANGNSHSWRFPHCGREVRFGLATGQSMVRADKASRQKGRTMETMLASRVKHIEGVESKGKYHDFMAELDVLDWRALEAEMDRIEIGLKTDMDIVCNQCGAENNYDIPFGGDFFTPGGTR